MFVGYDWEGYNYEDAVLLNEKIVRDDVSSTVTPKSEIRLGYKAGPEEITRDIPNVERMLITLMNLNYSLVLRSL